jgi:hypothetical protein
MHGEGGEEGALPINGAVLSLILIFIPGIICYGLVAALGDKRKRDNTTIFLQIFMYGVASYLILYILHSILPSYFLRLGIDISNVHIFNPGEIEKSPVDLVTIIAATVVGIIEGILITININYDLSVRFCHLIRLTKRFGDADVWSLLLNSKDTDNWVTIRHKERGHIYQGYVQGFSGGDEKRELLLVEVRVFDLETAEPAGTIPVLYMSFKDEDVVLEFGTKPDKSALLQEPPNEHEAHSPQ